jgi:hypothetical protein
MLFYKFSAPSFLNTMSNFCFESDILTKSSQTIKSGGCGGREDGGRGFDECFSKNKINGSLNGERGGFRSVRRDQLIFSGFPHQGSNIY